MLNVEISVWFTYIFSAMLINTSIVQFIVFDKFIIIHILSHSSSIVYVTWLYRKEVSHSIPSIPFIPREYGGFEPVVEKYFPNAVGGHPIPMSTTSVS